MTDWKRLTEEEAAGLSYTRKGPQPGTPWEEICLAAMDGPVFIACKEEQKPLSLLASASSAACRFVGKGILRTRSLGDGSGIVISRKRQS